jgi:hypothetical protein
MNINHMPDNTEEEYIKGMVQNLVDRISWNIGDALADPGSFYKSYEWEEIEQELFYQIRHAYITGRAMANMEGQIND